MVLFRNAMLVLTPIGNVVLGRTKNSGGLQGAGQIASVGRNS